jgi:hypothetical protein
MSYPAHSTLRALKLAGGGLSDSRVLHETERMKPAPARSLSVGFVTWQGGLVPLSITVVVDTISAVNACRCFRTLADAYVHPPPDRR